MTEQIQDTVCICIGEATVELTRDEDGRFALASGGDTFNTAVYLARAGISTAFITALGSDPYSDAIVALTEAEGIRADLSLRVPGRLPSLTLIDYDAQNTKRKYSWHEAAPARDLFEMPDWNRLVERMVSARLIYFSGITLSLYSNVGIGRFLAAVELARGQGAIIAFDPNFRPHAWQGNLTRARTVFTEALKRTDIALPTYDDEAVLWGDPSPEATIERLQAFGVLEIIVKNGPNGAIAAIAGKNETIPVPQVIVPVDMNAAGDAFNAGYLAARLQKRNPADAVMCAHKLAADVIRHSGAIMPRAKVATH